MYCWKYYYANICSTVKVTEDQSYCLSSCSGQIPTQRSPFVLMAGWSPTSLFPLLMTLGKPWPIPKAIKPPQRSGCSHFYTLQKRHCQCNSLRHKFRFLIFVGLYHVYVSMYLRMGNFVLLYRWACIFRRYFVTDIHFTLYSLKGFLMNAEDLHWSKRFYFLRTIVPICMHRNAPEVGLYVRAAKSRNQQDTVISPISSHSVPPASWRLMVQVINAYLLKI